MNNIIHILSTSRAAFIFSALFTAKRNYFAVFCLSLQHISKYETI